MAAEKRKCFSILGLREGASENEIRKSYKKLALQYHPDKNESDDAKGKFQEIGYAYKFLTDGPDAFETSNPHDIREEFLRRLFEEMFFARFRSPFGGFPFFCDESDEDDYYIYSDDDDDESWHTKGNNSREGRRTYENTYSRAPRPAQTFQEPSKKQQRKREKRQRQKERQKERKEQEKPGKQKEQEIRGTRNVYTDDVHAEPMKEATPKKAVPKDVFGHRSENKTDIQGSRPDTPILNQQPQKPTKKQKKKNECEQRKRDKEMEEIAAKLTKKHERDIEKQLEKEKQAAQKKEEEKENDLNVQHFFENGKKSRKARQREKRRQENSDTPEPVLPGKPLENITLNYNNSMNGKCNERSGSGSTRTPVNKKTGLYRNRFDILDDLSNVNTPTNLGTSISADSFKGTQFPGGRSPPTSGGKLYHGMTMQTTDIGFSKSSQHTTNSSSFTKASAVKSSFKHCVFQNTNHNNGSSTGFGIHTAIKPGVTNEETGNIKSGPGCGDNGKNVKSKANSGIPDHMKSRHNEFEEGSERKFVEDWSTVYYSDEEVEVEDVAHVASPQYSQNENVSQHYGLGQNSSHDNFGNGYDSSYYTQGDPCDLRWYPAPQREFIPRNRGYQGPPEFGPYFRRPPGFQPHMRGPPPFSKGNTYPHPQPQFKGGYPVPPLFHFNRGGYSIPNYGPPMGMPGSRNNFDGSGPCGAFYPGGRPNIPDDRKGNVKNINKPKSVSPKKSFNRGFGRMQSEKKEYISVKNQSEVETRENGLPVAGFGVPSSEYSSRPPENQPNMTNNFVKNMLSNVQNNQAGSEDSLDSLDDFVLYETGTRPTDKQKLRDSRPDPPHISPYGTIDMGLDEFLSKDNLGVPAGMFSDSIKNYYK